MSIFLNGSLLSSPEKSSQFTATALSSSPDPVTNFTSQSAFKTSRQRSDDQSEKKSAYSISNILEKKENSPAGTSSSASDDDTGSPRCGSTEEEHGSMSTSDTQPTTSVFPHFLFPGTAFSPPSTVSDLSSPMVMHNSVDISPAQIQQAYLSFLVGQQLNTAAVAAANPLRILAQDQVESNTTNSVVLVDE
ncbi:hypothetical protein GCK32_008362 [Trichostrongylus colubriformis]|uniref:Uncharacterized protein n=1 Tax=Trichostrongylus colubriformis TaxID=6319 RepID=A0AAN8FPP6_TRICO